MMIGDIGRLLILIGGLLLVLGLFFTVAGRLPGVGRLPGDILIQRDNFTFYLPLGTMIVISVVLTVVLSLFARFFR